MKFMHRNIEIFSNSDSLEFSKNSQQTVPNSTVLFLENCHFSNTVQWNYGTFLAYRTELNMASWGPNFFNISMFYRVRLDRTELCFIAFEWFYLMYLMHLNDFIWCIWCIWMIFMSSIRSNRTRKNIEILKKFDSIRFGSIFQ